MDDPAQLTPAQGFSMYKFILVLLAVVIGWKLLNYSSEVSYGPGVMAPDEPQQEALDPPVSFKLDQFTVTKVANFRIKAKVLSKEGYHFGREANLSPVDLALGWGKMSDESIIEQIQISQSGRFYRWRVDSFPIPRREIETQSANMHLIPANENVANAIDDVRKGDIIELSGNLVNAVSDENGWRWTTSLTRNDTGNGACELIWVESFRVLTL
ncbi:hypothetical protein [Kangiella sp.]|uniref:hypothetical protein n=1 Tax=Kangiella sp. TaxID=1920245 RepID=UPI003A93A57B